VTSKQKAKIKKYFDRGLKWEEISIITGAEVKDIKDLMEPKPKTKVEVKKTIQEVKKKIQPAVATPQPAQAAPAPVVPKNPAETNQGA